MNDLTPWLIYLALASAAPLLYAATRRRLGRARAAWMFLPLGGIATGCFAAWVSEPHHRLFADFYKAYYPAAAAVLQSPGAIEPLITSRDFVNVPIVAWLFAPLVGLGEPTAGWVFTAIGIVATLAAWALLCRLARLDAHGAAWLLFLFAINGPLYNSFREGNTTHIILFLLVLALAATRRGWDLSAGLLLGFCSVIKLPLLLFGLYFVVKRRWRVVAGGAAALLLAGALSLAIFGLPMNQLWHKRCVEPFTKRPMVAYNVQSLDGFLARLRWGQALLRNWDPVKTGYLHRAVRYPTLLALFGLAGYLVALEAKRRRAESAEPVSAATSDSSFSTNDRDALEFCLVLNLALVTSPLSWSHYYLFLLMPFAFALGGNILPRGDRLARALLCVAVVLTSLPVVIIWPADVHVAAVFARTLVSFPFLGGACSLAALYRAAWARRRLPASD